MELAAIFGLVMFIIFLFIISPFINFIGGYIAGLCIKLVFGATFVSGLAMLGINIFPDSIPLFCGILGVIGSFFKSTNIKRENGDGKKSIFK